MQPYTKSYMQPYMQPDRVKTGFKILALLCVSTLNVLLAVLAQPSSGQSSALTKSRPASTPSLPLARVQRVTGKAQVQCSGPSKGTFLRLPLKRSTALYDGNLITTMSRSRVQIMFNSGAIILVGPLTTAQFGINNGKSQIKVLKGTIYERRIRGNRKLFVKVPLAKVQGASGPVHSWHTPVVQKKP